MNTLALLQHNFNTFLTEKFNLTSSFVAEHASLKLNNQTERSNFGDLSTSIPLHISSLLGKAAQDISLEIKNFFHDPLLLKIESAGPGFINIFLKPSAFITIAQEIFNQQEDFFTSSISQKRKILIEFVSANPTGPLHFGHGRNGIIGDVLGNVLKFIGHTVSKEFYVNDAGKQMQKLGLSLIIRCQQILGIEATIQDNGYQGEYLKDIAQQCINEHGSAVLEKPESFFILYAQEKILEKIKATLIKYNIHFDTFFFESTLHANNTIEKLIDFLTKRGLVYEKDGAVWFNATDFDDDKDRVVRKTNGELTYLAADIAYLKNKSDRGYNQLIMILGHDHHSFATRLQGIRKALEIPAALDIILYQLVRIKEGSQDFKMSKRSGKMIFLEDVINEVGTDVARFFYSNRKADAQLEFDLELALKTTDENPLFYIQYAYVRIKSILKKSFDIPELINISLADANELKESEFILIKKLIGLQKVLELINHNLQPHILSFYAIELAQEFHRYYTNYQIIDPKAIKTSRARLFILFLIKLNLGICLDLLGISKPDIM